MSDEIARTMDTVVLLPAGAILPDEARRLLWECNGSVHLVSDPAEALAELASCRQPRTIMIVRGNAWPELETMQRAITRYWPDARMEIVDEGEPQRRDADEGPHHERLSAWFAFLARPVATMSRRGRAAITAIAITLLLMTPIIWFLVLMRGR